MQFFASQKIFFLLVSQGFLSNLKDTKVMGEKGREMMMPILRCRPPTMCMRSKKPRYSTGLSLSLLPSRNYSISVCGPGKLHFFFEEKQPRNLVLFCRKLGGARSD